MRCLLGTGVLLMASCFSFGAASKLSQSEAVLEVEKRAIAFFIENAHPQTGLVLDKADNFGGSTGSFGVASIASTGFGLAVIANAADRGFMDRKAGYDYVVRALRFVETGVDHYNGWLLHWVDWSTGEQVWNSEYSTIDTALFVAGALYAAQVYPNSEVSEIANRIYRNMNFYDMRTNGGSLPSKMTLSMGYEVGFGYIPAQWNMYAEQLVLVLLGLGHPTDPLPIEAWSAFERRAFPNEKYKTAWGLDQALFVHQYSHLFVDFRNFTDRFGDYHNNSVEITRYHRELRDIENRFATLREGFWGFSAGEAPEDKYRVYTALYYQGTVCVGCALGSAMFMPTEIISDMTDWMNGKFAPQIWGRYGFVDSIDIDQNWFARTVLGITVGPAYLSLANLDDRTSLWLKFMAIPEIQAAMARARAG